MHGFNFSNLNINTRTPVSYNDQAETFCKWLYHDVRHGNVFKFCFKNSIWEEKRYVTIPGYNGNFEHLLPQNYKGDKNDDQYVSLNSFKGNRRRASELFNTTSIYIDLDCHDAEKPVVVAKIAATIARLQEAFNDKSLPVPTIINNTGRGLAIFYIFKNSIAHTKTSGKSEYYCRLIRTALTEKYSSILQEDCLQVDNSTKDVSRVVRLPGSKNLLSGDKLGDMRCKVLCFNSRPDGTPLYYDLSELTSYVKLKKRRKKKSGQEECFIPAVKTYRNVSQEFLKNRIKGLEKLRDLRGEKCNGYRTNMSLIYYSAAVTLYGDGYAFSMLQRFNAKFTDPLLQNELLAIRRATKKATDENGEEQGFYRFTTEEVVSRLACTAEEAELCNLKRERKREAEARIKRKKKEERNADILSTIIDNPQTTYAEIAEKYGISQRTVMRLAKDAGIHRRKPCQKIKYPEYIFNEHKEEEEQPCAANAI